MIYNYLRFDSFFDFGIQYSLTINDFTKAEYHTHLAAVGFYNYLFAFPVIKPEFPFFFSNYSDLNVNGFYFRATTETIGQFFRAIPTFFVFFGHRVLKYIQNNKRVFCSLMWISFCVLAPCIIIFSVWESGYGTRYCVDFSWQMTLGALAVAFLIYINSCSESIKKVLYGFIVVSTLMCLIVNASMYISYEQPTDAGHLIARFSRLWEFWK